MIVPLSMPGLVTGVALAFAHTMGEFGVVLMVGGNIPGVTRTVSISVYDQVQASNYAGSECDGGAAANLLLCGAGGGLWAEPQNAAAKIMAPGTDQIDEAFMSSPVETKSASSILTASIRKTLASTEREFSLDVEFSAAPGFTILFGPSGAGKTTLLDCVAGLATPDSGRIAVGERVFFEANSRVNVPVAKRGVGYVLQDLALFPHLTVEQNVEYGLARLTRSARKQRAARDAAGAPHRSFAGTAPSGNFGGRTAARGAGAVTGNRSLRASAG